MGPRAWDLFRAIERGHKELVVQMAAGNDDRSFELAKQVARDATALAFEIQAKVRRCPECGGTFEAHASDCSNDLVEVQPASPRRKGEAIPPPPAEDEDK